MGVNNRQLFVDSNFFIAVFNPRDTLHKKAIIFAKKLKERNPQFIISNFIFLEIVTVLSQRVSKKIAISLGRHLVEDSQLEIIHIDRHLNNLSWDIFQRVKRKNVSFVDCSILAVMKTEGIKKLLTFDTKDFTAFKKDYHFSFYR